MLTLPRFDADGTYIPFAADDELLECGLDDESWGEPESWPAWTDAGIWETGPETDVTIEPFAPSLEDELDYREWSMEVDRRWRDARVESDGHVTDADVAIATGCAG